MHTKAEESDIWESYKFSELTFLMCITCKSWNIVNEYYISYIQRMKFLE
jgi:hypothetical protein